MQRPVGHDQRSYSTGILRTFVSSQFGTQIHFYLKFESYNLVKKPGS